MIILRNAWQKITNSEFTRNVLFLMTGTTISQAIPILASPVLTRLYTPEQYGTLGLFLALTSIFTVIASFRYELAIMLPADDQDAINVFALAVLITLTLSAVAFFVVVIFHDQLIGFLNNPDISIWLYYIPLMILLIGFYQCMLYWHSRRKQYNKIATAEVARGGVKVGTQIGSAYTLPGIGTAGLITGAIAGQLTATILIWLQAKNDLKDKWSQINRKDIFIQAKLYIKFPLINAPHTLIGNLSDKLPIMLLTSFFSSQVAGFYSLSLVVVNLPSILISNALGHVFYQQISKNYCDGVDFYPLVVKCVKMLFLISIIPYIILFLFAPYIFGFIFGWNWYEAGVYTRISIPWIIVRFIIAPLSYIPLTLGRQAKAFKLELLGIIATATALIVGGLMQDVILSLILLSIFTFIIISYNLFWIISLAKASNVLNSKE